MHTHIYQIFQACIIHMCVNICNIYNNTYTTNKTNSMYPLPSEE